MSKMIIICISIIVLFVLIYSKIIQPKHTSLFPEEEIILSNIEQIEILDVHSSESIIIVDKSDINKISSFLLKLNSHNVNVSDTNYDIDPVFHIYIVNVGRHANTAIAVYQDSIAYRGNMQYMTSEQSSSLFQLLEEICK